ncbi:MAG: hypothetical protein QW303_02675 [Nitrososphaerota archaeon]
MSLLVKTNAGVVATNAEILKTRFASKSGWRSQSSLMEKMINATDDPKAYLNAKKRALQDAVDAASATYATNFKEFFETTGLGEEEADKLALDLAKREYEQRVAIINKQYPDIIDNFSFRQGMSKTMGSKLGVLKVPKIKTKK